MVKKYKRLFALLLVGATLVGCGGSNESLPFNENATDMITNNNGIKLSKALSKEDTIGYSQTFIQHGVNQKNDNLVLRFATAVKGGIDSLSYTRAALEGVSDEQVRAVELVYEGINFNEATQYFTDAGLSENEADKGQYYWACYSIEYTSPAYYDYDMIVSFSVNGEVVSTNTANLQDMIDESNKLYKSIYIDGDVNVLHGQNVNTANLVVKAVGHDGSESVLEATDYTITTNKIAKFGEKTEVKVVHNQDSSLFASKEVVVITRVEGESGTIVGGTTKTEPEYRIENSSFVKGSNVTFAGNFIDAVKAGTDATLTLSYFSKTAHVGGFKMKVSNSNLHDIEKDKKQMNPLQVNTICDLFVNDKAINVTDNVIIPGTPVYTGKDFEPLYGVYSIINIENVSFKVGFNTLRFNFKLSTKGELNSWNESPSTFNVDYVDFYSTGSEIKKDATIVSSEIDSSIKMPEYGQKIEDVIANTKLLVFATMSDNTIVAFENDEITITSIKGGNRDNLVGTEDYIVYGEHTITYKINGYEYEGNHTFNVEEKEYLHVDNVYLKYEDNRVIYEIYGRCRGLDETEVSILANNEKEVSSSWVFGLNTFRAHVDVTDYPAGSGMGTLAFYPYINVNGNNKRIALNSEEKLKFSNEIIYHNNTKYQLREYDNMPVVYVATLSYSNNTKDAVITDVTLVNKDNKVYYTVTGYSYGFDTDKIVIDELTTRNSTYDETTHKFVFEYDVTNRANGDMWPHVTVDGVKYVTNRDSAAGDLAGNGVTANGIWFAGSSTKVTRQTLTFNSRTYQLYTQYSIPVLSIS